MTNVKIWYLFNSGFALRVENKLLIFDYFYEQPVQDRVGLEGGVISAEDLIGLDVYVFVSHGHHDHYNRIIFSWEQYADRVTYILSDDVKKTPDHNIHLVKPHEMYHFHDLSVKTLLSNDLGVAFYIEVEGLHIFHSGDLNWWHWTGESKEWNLGMEKIFKEEMSALNGLPLDFAFIPVDPRLGKHYLLGLNYFNTIKPEKCTIFPMHFGDQWLGILDQEYVLQITHRGQSFDISK